MIMTNEDKLVHHMIREIAAGVNKTDAMKLLNEFVGSARHYELPDVLVAIASLIVYNTKFAQDPQIALKVIMQIAEDLLKEC